uniref:non-specific serine/threonine protein kinase n=1 Tax=Amphilophus citrinellus TaxID=61819 RepID=A0A3Q0RWW7_AMPCI
MIKLCAKKSEGDRNTVEASGIFFLFKKSYVNNKSAPMREFTETYKELHKLGEGGFGSVYAGWRMSDSLPVSITHMFLYLVHVLNGKTHMIPLEVLLMLKVGGEPLSVGTSPAVSLLDWCDLEEEVLLVMERPVPCMSLHSYMENNGGPLEEHVAKVQPREAPQTIMMHSKGVFHRAIKTENLLLETGSKPQSVFSGTSAYGPPEFFTRGKYEAIPTTVWQLLYEMLNGVHQFRTSSFVFPKDYCQNFLKHCLARNPQQRATLEQIQKHPWLQNQAQLKP